MDADSGSQEGRSEVKDEEQFVSDDHGYTRSACLRERVCSSLIARETVGRRRDLVVAVRCDAFERACQSGRGVVRAVVRLALGWTSNEVLRGVSESNHRRLHFSLFVWFARRFSPLFACILNKSLWLKCPRAIRGPVLSAKQIRNAGASRPRPTEGGMSGTMLAIPTLLKLPGRTNRSGDPTLNNSAIKNSRTTRLRTGSDSTCPCLNRSIRNPPRVQSRRPIKVSPNFPISHNEKT